MGFLNLTAHIHYTAFHQKLMAESFIQYNLYQKHIKPTVTKDTCHLNNLKNLDLSQKCILNGQRTATAKM